MVSGAVDAWLSEVDTAGGTSDPALVLDIWVGGSSAAAFRRIGKLADGWLGSFLTPTEAQKGREAIERAAAEAGRQSYGISYTTILSAMPRSAASF
jgi:alkanesulfonate monooxygenase SsuD/methylene tetrahydromethanopterin reductase-like flavin-dependent oxidoreductase (luciferase family)